MLRTNDKYKADYITAINEKRKVAVAKKRSRNKRIVCFSLAFLLMVGVLSAVMLSKPEKSPTPNGDTNVLLNTSSGEEEAKPTTSTDDPPAENSDTDASVNTSLEDENSKRPTSTDGSSAEPGDTDVIVNPTPGEDSKQPTSTDGSSAEPGDTDVIVNPTPGEDSKQPTGTDDPPADGIVIYADTNSITNTGTAIVPVLGKITHHHDLDYEDGKLYHIYLDVYLPYATVSPEMFLSGFFTVDKYGADYHLLEVNGLEKYLEIFTRKTNDRFNIDNAEDYIVVEEGSNGKISLYFDHYKLRLDHIKEYCLKYWSEAEHGEALSELKAKGISEEWVEKYGYIWWKRYDASWYCEESNSKYDIFVYDMLDDMGIVCERNEYGYPIFDIAKEDFDMLLTLPCAYDVYLLEKGTTPEAIYKAKMETPCLA